MGVQVDVLTSHPGESRDGIHFCNEMPKIEGHYSHALICTATGLHLESFRQIVETVSCKKVLIEKPLDKSSERCLELEKLAADKDIKVWVAYNLRFLEVLSDLRQSLPGLQKKMRKVELRCGQHLGEWRPGRQYQQVYSSNEKLGGGVDLDLSHEIDLMLWLFGEPEQVLTLKREKVSQLAIETPGLFQARYQYDGFEANVELDYFRPKHRSIVIHGEKGPVLELDLTEADVTRQMEQSYLLELEDFLDESTNKKSCTLQEACRVLKWIQR